MYNGKMFELVLDENVISDMLADKEWSWCDLAKYAGISRNTLRRHFNGSGITVDTISKVAWALQVDVKKIVMFRNKK